MWTQGFANYKNSGECSTPGRRCRFFSICGRDDTTYMVKRSHVFPELEEVGTAED